MTSENFYFYDTYNDVDFNELFNNPSDEPFEYSDDESDNCIDDLSDKETEPAEPMALKNHRANQEYWKDRPRLNSVLAVLETISSQQLDLPLFLDALFYGDSGCHSAQKCVYARESLMVSDELPRILQAWHRPPRRPDKKKSRRPFGARTVMENFALDCVIKQIDRGLRESAPFFVSEPEDFSEEQLLGTDFSLLKEPVQKINSPLWSILRSAAYTAKQEKRNKHKDPDMIILNIISQLQYTRSSCRGRIAKLWAIYLKSCGLSAQAFDAVHALGISMSHRWAANAYTVLPQRAMDKLCMLMRTHSYNLNHDNLNVPIRVFSQRLHNQSHFVSATAWTVWILPSHVHLSPDINRQYNKYFRLHSSTLFNLSPILLGDKVANEQLFDQKVDIVLRMLLNSPEFREYSEEHKNDSVFVSPKPVSQLEGGPENVVEGFIGPTLDQEEASYEGQIKVNAIFHILHYHTVDEQTKTGLLRFIVWLGDQLTADRLRGLWHQRHEDHNSFHCLNWMLPLFGWFHLVMAFANSLHKQYLGTSAAIGSLRHAFDILKWKGLITTATKGPFWHNLDEAIHHISEAHFLASWLAVTKADKLSDLTKYPPSELQALAVKLLPKSEQDPVLRQWIMWNMDVLPYLDLRAAIRKGDVGRMENLLPILPFHFNGGGNSNYMAEVLNLLQGLRQEWPEEIKNYVRQWCWVFSRSGKPNSYLPFDQGQEHNVRDIKVTYRSFGPGATIEYIGRISPGIPTFQRVCRHMETQFGTTARGTKHGVPDKQQDVKLLMDHYMASDLHTYKAGRTGGFAVDVITKGAADIGAKAREWFEKRTLERSTEEDYTNMENL